MRSCVVIKRDVYQFRVNRYENIFFIFARPASGNHSLQVSLRQPNDPKTSMIGA